MFVISSHFFLIVDNPGGSQRTHLLSGLLSPGYASHNFLVLHFCVEYTTSVMIFAMKWLFNTLINLQRNLLYRAFTVVTQKQKELSDSRYPFLCQYTGLWMSCKNLHNLIRILCLVLLFLKKSFKGVTEISRDREYGESEHASIQGSTSTTFTGNKQIIAHVL